jgi:hypothetical protein
MTAAEVQHTVLLTFASTADRDEAKVRLERLPAAIPQIRSMTIGLDLGLDPTASDLVLVTTHDDADALRAYIADPAHQAYLAWAKPRMRSRAAVDSAL